MHREIQRDIVIECAKDGCERSDIVVTEDEMWEMVRRAEYDSQGDAHIEIKNIFAFGTSTAILKAHRVSTRLSIAMCKALIIMYAQKRYYSSPFLMMSVALEFGTSKECFCFIQHDFVCILSDPLYHLL